MTQKFVYLAGPITGLSYGETTDWRAGVSAQFAPGIIGVSPMRVKEFLARKRKIGHSYPEDVIMGAARAINTRDKYDCTHADMVLAWLPKWAADKSGTISVGTLKELGWASAMNIPTVIVTDDKRVFGHPLVEGDLGWIVPTLEDGVAAVNAVLGVYAQETDIVVYPPRLEDPADEHLRRALVVGG